ncbi:unnamed protein product [Linum tenue]|uniref:Uncharacterized protein n=1 Tax=Linum tenue TaxID=586396 RepID=A0AAV0KSE2_9ROSI|nr:unnamed protein product [Linum tenue]
MSRPQDPHRPFFPLGNPFRRILPKGLQMSPRLISILNSFEETLAERLRKLIPEDQGDVLSLTWMKLAMESLCETHTDMKTLITDLDLPVTGWDQNWIDVYLDDSMRLLDTCIALSSEISRLNQGHLLLQCALHNLESGTPECCMKARSALDNWRHHIYSKNPRVQSCRSILDSLVEALNLPKVKNSSKGKVLLHAIYGVKAVTIFVCSVFASAFSSSSKNLLDLAIPDTVLWARAFSDLQTRVSGEIRELFPSEKSTGLKELDSVDSIVKTLYPAIRGVEEEALKICFTDLQGGAEKLSEGLDLLAKQVDTFFETVLSGREALLCNLRVTSSDMNAVTGGKIWEQQAVR